MHNGSVVSNASIKFMGYLLGPALILLVLYLSISQRAFGIACLLAPLLLLELMFYFLAITVSQQEKTREVDEEFFLDFMAELGYTEDVSGSFKVKMGGRYRNDPISIRVEKGNYALGDSEIEGQPHRYYIYSVGEDDRYLLVSDGLQEKLRLFKKK